MEVVLGARVAGVPLEEPGHRLLGDARRGVSVGELVSQGADVCRDRRREVCIVQALRHEGLQHSLLHLSGRRREEVEGAIVHGEAEAELLQVQGLARLLRQPHRQRSARGLARRRRVRGSSASVEKRLQSRRRLAHAHVVQRRQGIDRCACGGHGRSALVQEGREELRVRLLALMHGLELAQDLLLHLRRRHGEEVVCALVNGIPLEEDVKTGRRHRRGQVRRHHGRHGSHGQCQGVAGRGGLLRHGGTLRLLVDALLREGRQQCGVVAVSLSMWPELSQHPELHARRGVHEEVVGPVVGRVLLHEDLHRLNEVHLCNLVGCLLRGQHARGGRAAPRGAPVREH
mmetsp:Transcript_71090/g.211947  ORF Transcript_71090/g.211947 Transcript_71090/m.211947 type:complete len:344 (+) Transcript_71090:345-1376(+)